MSWYNLNDKDRIELIYSKHKLKDFWDWWSDGKPKVMEVRIQDYNLIKKVANTFKLPWSASGVYVKSSEELKQVALSVRDKTTMWFGINPRKKNHNMFGGKSYGGKDCHVEELGFLFLDIDRVKKDGPATSEDLKNSEVLADLILKKLALQGWDKSYVKICSGNGVQLIIKLDESILIPPVTWAPAINTYISNEEFRNHQDLIRKGFGAQIVRFAKQYRAELGVEVDKAGFNIGRVGALPTTKNFKHNGFTWRGIIELKTGENKGFGDYVYSAIDDIKTYASSSTLMKGKKLALPNRRMVAGKLRENELINLLLTHDFKKVSGINNTIWFYTKMLVRDSKIDLNGKEFREIHNKLKVKHDRTFTLNLPEQQFEFNEKMVNTFCIENCIPPVYKDIWKLTGYERKYKVDILENMDDMKDYNSVEIDLSKDRIMDDLRHVKELMDEERGLEKPAMLIFMAIKKIYIGFLNASIIKYGHDTTKLLNDYVLHDFFNY